MYMPVNYTKKVSLLTANPVKSPVLLSYNTSDSPLMKISSGLFHPHESEHYLSFLVYLEPVFDNLCFYFGAIDSKF